MAYFVLRHSQILPAGCGFIHNHPRHGLAVFFLFRGVNAMGVGVHGQAVNLFLYRKVLQLAVVIRIVHLEYGDGSARTRHIDSLETGIKFNNVRATGQWEEYDGLVTVKIDDRHKFVPFTREESAMMLRIKRHPMVSFAPPDRISPHDFVSRRIKDRENILILKIYIHLTRNRIVLRHSRFAVEVQWLYDFIFSDIDDRFRFASFIGNVELVERRGVSAAVRLGFRWNFLDYLHLAQVHHADGVIAGIRGIELLQFGHVLDAFSSRRI